jgi:hypothetical protein
MEDDAYPQRVADRILPKSSPGLTLTEAFEEWEFWGNTQDHGEACEECQLCGQDRLRYHFEIVNPQTCNTMLVGSHCIEKFELAVLDEGGKRLNPTAATTKLRRLEADMREQDCMRVLEELYKRQKNDYTHSALECYKADHKLSPRLAATVFYRLSQPHTGILYTPSFFSISLRRSQHKEDLQDMEAHRVHLIWGALTPPQREKAIDLGHSEPPGWTEPMEAAA